MTFTEKLLRALGCPSPGFGGRIAMPVLYPHTPQWQESVWEFGPSVYKQLQQINHLTQGSIDNGTAVLRVTLEEGRVVVTYIPQPKAGPWTYEPDLWGEGPAWVRRDPDQPRDQLPLATLKGSGPAGWACAISNDPQRGWGSCASTSRLSLEAARLSADSELAKRGYKLDRDAPKAEELLDSLLRHPLILQDLLQEMKRRALEDSSDLCKGEPDPWELLR